MTRHSPEAIRRRAARKREYDPQYVQRSFTISLDEATALAVNNYAQHTNNAPHTALLELIGIGLSSDPASPVITNARIKAYTEMREYVIKRLVGATLEIKADLMSMADPTQSLPAGWER